MMPMNLDGVEINIGPQTVVHRFRDHIPVVFAPEELSRRIPFIVVRARNRYVIANVVPEKYVGSHQGGIHINTVLYEYLGRPDHILLEHMDPSRTIFVYGTLLSRYWDPHRGTLHEGWYGLSKYPMIRGIVGNMVAVWPMDSMFPYAIRREKAYILGEVYVNLEPEDVMLLDSVESLYDRRDVVVFPAENVINGAPIHASIYLYGRPMDGYSAITFRYGDSFFLKPEGKLITYRYSRDLYVRWIEGNIPVIISSPHGGYMRPENIGIHRRRNADPKTMEIAELITTKVFEKSDWEAIPSTIINRVHPSRIDPNRPSRPKGYASRIYRSYHRTIRRIIRKNMEKYGRTIILDIHGMRGRGEDIVLGTNFGRSIQRDSPFLRELEEQLEEKFTISIDKEGYSGHYITQKYGAMKNVEALQVEIARDVRIDAEKTEALAEIIAEVILTNKQY